MLESYLTVHMENFDLVHYPKFCPGLQAKRVMANVTDCRRSLDSVDPFSCVLQNPMVERKSLGRENQCRPTEYDTIKGSVLHSNVIHNKTLTNSVELSSS